MHKRITRGILAAAITVTTLTATATLAAPAEAAPVAHSATTAANKGLRHYTFMRDIYKSLDKTNAWVKAHPAAKALPKNKAVLTVQRASIYRGSVTVTGTPRNFVITAKNVQDHITKRISNHAGVVAYLP